MRALKICLLLLALTHGAACAAGDELSGDEAEDPGFDSWTPDGLPSAWLVQEGAVERTATWHQRDYGSSLLGAPVVPYQDRALGSEACQLEFLFVADVDQAAQVSVEIDAGADGTAEQVHQVPSAAWTPLSFTTSAELPAGLLRTTIRKLGEGRAVLAHIQANVHHCGESP